MSFGLIPLEKPVPRTFDTASFAAKFLARKKLIGRLELPFYKYRQHDKNRTKNKKILKNYDEKLKNIICGCKLERKP